MEYLKSVLSWLFSSEVSQDETSSLIYSYLLQESSPDEPSSEQKLSIDMENCTDSKDGKFDPWTPLNCLVEAANRTKSSKQNSRLTRLAESTNRIKSSKMNLQGFSLAKMEQPSRSAHNPETTPKSEVPNIPEGSLLMSKAKAKDLGVKSKLQDDKNGTSSVAGSGIMKRKRARGAGLKKASASEVVCPSAQFLLDASVGKQSMRNHPVWFSLVASKDQ